MNNLKKKVIAAPYPQKLNRLFSKEKIRMISALVNFVYLGDGKTAGGKIDKHLPNTIAIIGQIEMPESRLRLAPGLKAIFNVEGNFYQNIDYDYCFNNGIYVLNCGEAYALAVAEMALGFAIDLGRGITKEDRKARSGNEKYLAEGCLDSVLLSDSDVGIIGFGFLGKALTKLLTPFRCKVRVYDPWVPDSIIIEQGCIPTPLEDILKKSRFIFVMAGVTKDNQGFLSAEKLSLIKKDSFFILMSRAAIVDFDALCSLTEKGKFTAATDVFPEEPIPKNHRVRKNENILLSPHRAGGIPQSFTRIGEMVIDDLSLILRGLPPLRMQIAMRETVKNLISKPAG
ncbi:MAG: hydroxyacid dehydrogenase [Candidatus Aenigmarchaeota archaeon]|nr:hydroxyacid dehydrogenase [Candidatus Aenigmarchaeota archaeon]